MLSITNLKGFLQQAQMPASSIYSLLTQRSALVEAALPPSPAHSPSALSFWAFFFFKYRYNFKERLQYCTSLNRNSLDSRNPGADSRDQYQPFFWQMLFAAQGGVYVPVALTSSMKQHYSPPLTSLSWEPLLGPAPISKHKKLQRLLPRGQFLDGSCNRTWSMGSTLWSHHTMQKQENLFSLCLTLNSNFQVL